MKSARRVLLIEQAVEQTDRDLPHLTCNPMAQALLEDSEVSTCVAPLFTNTLKFL
jgi:hypothetical protein